MRIHPFVLAAAALAGCGSPAANRSDAANASAPAEASLNAQPVKEEHKALALTPAWLAGRWQTGDGNCGAGDTFFTFHPDGRYTFMDEQGRWSLAGDALTIEVTEPSSDGGGKAGDRHTNQVRPIGPNEAEFRSQGADPIRVFRCHQG
jgi:predicted 2-oxoglutarate/Fe(II)-dependent dioxygenase YbiX